jgi:hypothetical protein
MTKVCCHCKVNPRRTSHNWCASCHAAHMREWRKTHPLKGLAKKKDTCRSYAGSYVRRGHITVKPCEICGETAEMHHPDYNDPTRVEWLCREHHLELHQEVPNLDASLTSMSVSVRNAGVIALKTKQTGRGET